MDVIVKGSPSIEIGFKTKVIKVEGSSFDPSGKYPDLMAGDLVGRGESVPAEFSFRASGGKSIKDGRAYIKRIKGNSVVWNQKIKNATFADASQWESERSEFRIEGGVAHIKATREFSNLLQVMRPIVGHTYLVVVEAKGTVGYNLSVNFCGGGDKIIGGFTSDFSLVASTITYSSNIQQKFQLYCYESDAEWAIRKVQVIDLTQMFGAGNEPTTIEEFNARKPIVEDENAYNEGKVIHMTAEGIKSVGDNAWGGTLERGKLTNGNDSASAEMLRSIDYVRVLPSQEYYVVAPQNVGQVYFYPSFYDSDKNYIGELQYVNNFTAPSNAAYMRFFLYDTSGSAIPIDYEGLMLTLVHSGWKQDTDAGYQPYWQDTLPLPIIRKYFPDGMKKAGSAYDEICYNKASGKWEKVVRIGSVDMGTLNWKNLDASNGMFYLNVQEIEAINMAKHVNTEAPTNLMSSLYRSAPTFAINNLDKVLRGPFTTAFSGYLTIKDTSYTDAATFKAAMQGVILYYELAEPIVTELDEADQNFRDYYKVADFGTEMSQSAVPSAAFSADIIYQFNAVDMIREHEIEINELQSIIATMQAQLESLTSNNG